MRFASWPVVGSPGAFRLASDSPTGWARLIATDGPMAGLKPPFLRGGTVGGNLPYSHAMIAGNGPSAGRYPLGARREAVLS